MNILSRVRKAFFSSKKDKALPSKLKEQSLVKKIWENFKKRFDKKSSLQKTNKEQELKKAKKSNNFEEKNEFLTLEEHIQNYEKMIERDFFAVILSAKAELRKWRSNIALAIEKNHLLPENIIQDLNHSMLEITELYKHTEIMINRFITKCEEYHEIIHNAKSMISPSQKLNQVTNSITRIRRNLEKGQKITNLHNDFDYKFIDKYLKEREQSSRSLSI